MQRHQRGLTLVELMTTLVVVGMLASIAVPGYRSVMLRGGRSEAKVALLQTASALERCFARYNAFNDSRCISQVALPHLTDSGRYRISAAQLNEVDYRIVAVPQDAQAADESCQTLSYDSAGHKQVSPAARESAGFCWSH